MRVQVSTECDANLSYDTQATIDKVSRVLLIWTFYVHVSWILPWYFPGASSSTLKTRSGQTWLAYHVRSGWLQGLRIMDLYSKKGIDPKRIYIKVLPTAPGVFRFTDCSRCVSPRI